MKKLSKKQTIIITAIVACIIVFVSVAIAVTVTHKRAQQQEYERASMEEETRTTLLVTESTTEEASESTTEQITKEATTQKAIAAFEKKTEKPKENSTQKKEDNDPKVFFDKPLFVVQSPIENRAFSENGGFYRYDGGAVKNIREVDGGFDVDVYVTVTRDEHSMHPEETEPQKGHIKFYIKEMSGAYIGNYTIVTKALKDGETDTAFVTVHLSGPPTSYYVSFSYPE